jgi:post-segregation antitoxin (ccd killing protein)
MTKPTSAERSCIDTSKANFKDIKPTESYAAEERLTSHELQWKKENKPGIEAYNNYIALHGLFNDRMRKF